MSQVSKKYLSGKTLHLAALISLSASLICAPAWADDYGPTVNVNTGATDNSIIGNNSQQANDSGIAVNGDVNGSNLNNNQNSNTLSTNNTNVLQPIVVSQPQYASSSFRGGGNAALVLPRNPLPMPNAALGRSNFGLQFGVQNNPGLAAMTGGSGNALGWFMQGALTIPFGKIPSVISSRELAKLDDIRQNRMDNQRRVMGNVNPNNGQPFGTDVKGRVIGLNAYNYSTVKSDKLPLQGSPAMPIGEIVSPRPKVLALKQATAFNQPLNTGAQVGLVEVGREYPYLGHTRSGWVKILLPTGKEAWTSTEFEYIKFDYTEIDTLAAAPVINRPEAVTRNTTKPISDKKRRS